MQQHGLAGGASRAAGAGHRARAPVAAGGWAGGCEGARWVAGGGSCTADSKGGGPAAQIGPCWPNPSCWEKHDSQLPGSNPDPKLQTCLQLNTHLWQSSMRTTPGRRGAALCSTPLVMAYRLPSCRVCRQGGIRVVSACSPGTFPRCALVNGHSTARPSAVPQSCAWPTPSPRQSTTPAPRNNHTPARGRGGGR